MHDGKENPAGPGENPGHQAAARHVAAQDHVHIVERAPHVCTRSIREELDRGAPKPGFRSEHEEDEKREKCPKQQTRGDGANSMQQPVSDLLYFVSAHAGLLRSLRWDHNGEFTFDRGDPAIHGFGRSP